MPMPSQEAIASAPARGFILGVLLPGLAQAIAQRPAWLLFWVPLVAGAWFVSWSVALALHLLSGLQMVLIMMASAAAVQRGLNTSAQTPLQTR